MPQIWRRSRKFCGRHNGIKADGAEPRPLPFFFLPAIFLVTIALRCRIMLPIGSPSGDRIGNRRETIHDRYPDRPAGRAPAHRRHCRLLRHRPPVCGAVWPLQGQDRLPPAAGAGPPARRQAHLSHRHHPHPGRRGQDHHHRGPDGRPAQNRQKRRSRPAGAAHLGPGVRRPRAEPAGGGYGPGHPHGRTSIFTSPGISTPSARPTTCWPLCWTTTSSRATPWASTSSRSSGSAAWT